MGKNTNWEPLLNCSGDFNSLKEDTIYENIVKSVLFVRNTVKSVPVFDILSTVFRVCLSILFKHRYQADLEAPHPCPPAPIPPREQHPYSPIKSDSRPDIFSGTDAYMYFNS